MEAEAEAASSAHAFVQRLLRLIHEIVRTSSRARQQRRTQQVEACSLLQTHNETRMYPASGPGLQLPPASNQCNKKH